MSWTRHVYGALGVLGVLAFFARPVQAADWTDRRLVLEGVTGLGTPVGLLGVLGRFDLVPWVSIGGGVGTSWNGHGEYAGILLGRLPFKARGGTLSALTLGTSYSVGGTYDVDPNPSCIIEDCSNGWVHSRYHIAKAHWLSIELGAEARLDSGFSVRGFLGLAKLANPSSAVCKNYDHTAEQWFVDQCKVPLPDSGHSGSFIPDFSGPSGMQDVIWVLGTAVGYAF